MTPAPRCESPKPVPPAAPPRSTPQGGISTTPSAVGSWFAVLAPAVALLSGEAAGWVLLVPAAGATLDRLRGRYGPPLRREEKLLLVAVALVSVAAAIHPQLRAHALGSPTVAARYAAFLLLIPAHLWLRRRPPGALATGLGLALAAVAGALGSWLAAVGRPASAAAVGGVALVAGCACLPLVPTFAARFGFAGAAIPITAAVLSASAFIVGPTVLQGSPLELTSPVSVLQVLALGLTLLVPTLHFLDAARRRHRPLLRTGFAGVVLTAGSALAALTLDAFGQTATAVFYLVVVSLLYVQVRQREREYYATPVERRKTLSATIITKNEGDRIGRCLDSLAGWVDEIVVLDSGSTDDTLSIARRYTDRVSVTDWPGYGPQKQRALERATCEWVLSIDADEALTPELRHDIDTALTEQPACVGYKLPWAVIVYGKRLDFGRSARAPLRLFLREGSRFTDAQVHETIILPPGRVGELRGRLLHYTQRDYGHAIEKVAKYGWLGAIKRFEAAKRGGGLIGATLRALVTFLQVWVIRLGLLDGPAGFVMAVLYGRVTFDKYAGLWALKRERRGDPVGRGEDF